MIVLIVAVFVDGEGGGAGGVVLSAGRQFYMSELRKTFADVRCQESHHVQSPI